MTIYQLQTIQPAKSDYQRLAELLDKRKTRRGGLSMPEFAETTVVTAGPKKGQKFRLKDSTYARRPMECLSVESMFQLVVLMFPAQSTKSVIGQIFAGYGAKEVPAEFLYVMADLAGARKTMERRIEPLFKSIGVEFRTQSESRKSRRTGDVTFSKEFDGGNLDLVTANSAAALAAETKRFGVFDELDRAKKALGDEGSPWAQFWARLKAWMDEKKGLAISTPTDEDSSEIFQLFLQGTQEEWFIHCPFCGEPQVMKIKHQSGYGLWWKTRNGRILKTSLEHVCKKCAKGYKEAKKYAVQQSGIWIQQGNPIDEYTASFHLSALNSNFETWQNIAAAYEKGLDDPAKMKEFTNLTMGLPWREVGARPKFEKVIRLKGRYQSETVPMGVLYITIGVDVQRGKDRYRNMTEEELSNEIAKAGTDIEEKNFPRIELEVLGIGPGHRTWSIAYRRFLGRTDNAYSGAFERFNEWATEISSNCGGFGFIREVDGMFFPVVKTFVDCGDGKYSDVVFQFCQRWDGCYPIKGANVLKVKGGDRKAQGDDVNLMNFTPWRLTKSGDTLIYTFSTNAYKSRTYAALEIERTDELVQKPSFCDFPRDYNNDYFTMLTAEERRTDGSYHASGRRNESLDCRGMALCAGDVHLTQLVEKYREAAVQGDLNAGGLHFKKMSKEMAKIKINRRIVIDDLCIRAKLPEDYYKY
jgi:phage terminase large subunit GpA-like protein